MNGLEKQIADIIEPTLVDMGYALVRIKMNEGTQRKLQIMADRANGDNINVDDCADISRTVSTLLDVADPISQEYTLEVSSAGIDRPLVKLEDFERFKGFEAKTQLMIPMDGRRKFQGTIMGTEGESILIQTQDQDEPHTLIFSNIESAQLILTKELIAFSQSA